jgi:dTDP-4-dehydrorhamnose reductase
VSILVIGADGLVGAALCRVLAANGRHVDGTTRRLSAKGKHHFLDLADSSIANAAIPEAETAVICASVNGFARCRADADHAYQVNVAAVEVLARRLSLSGCRVVYLSSSAVFDFRQPHMQADAPMCPTTVYGRCKALADRAVLAADPANTVIRLTKVMTTETSHFKSWLKTLSAGDRITAYTDLHFCPISLDYVASGISKVMDAGGAGIYQISGTHDISYAEAARHFAVRMGMDTGHVIAGFAVADGIPDEEVATFTSLDDSRLAALTKQRSPNAFDVMNAVFDPLIHELVGA